MTADDLQYRADKARQILDDPLVKEAIQRLTAEKVDQIIELPTWTPWAWRKRRELIAEVRALKNVTAALAEVILEGEHSASRGLGFA